MISDIASTLSASVGLAAYGQGDRTRALSDSVAMAPITAAAANEQTADNASSTVNLSANGQLRFATEQLQASARLLASAGNDVTAEQTQENAQKFVDNFNAARVQANRVSASNSAADYSEDMLNARSAATELTRTLDNATSANLREIGINSNRDGSLNLERQRFEQSLQNNLGTVSATLADSARAVLQAQPASRTETPTAPNELSVAVTAPQATVNEVAEEESAAPARTAAAPVAPSEPVDSRQAVNAINASGIATYQKVFAL